MTKVLGHCHCVSGWGVSTHGYVTIFTYNNIIALRVRILHNNQQNRALHLPTVCCNNESLVFIIKFKYTNEVTGREKLLLPAVY